MLDYSEECSDFLLSYAGARSYLKTRGVVLAEQTLRRKVCEGVLPCVRLGGRTYLQRGAIDEWINRSQVPASNGPLISGRPHQ